MRCPSRQPSNNRLRVGWCHQPHVVNMMVPKTHMHMEATGGIDMRWIGPFHPRSHLTPKQWATDDFSLVNGVDFSSLREKDDTSISFTSFSRWDYHPSPLQLNAYPGNAILHSHIRTS